MPIRRRIGCSISTPMSISLWHGNAIYAVKWLDITGLSLHGMGISDEEYIGKVWRSKCRSRVMGKQYNWRTICVVKKKSHHGRNVDTVPGSVRWLMQCGARMSGKRFVTVGFMISLVTFKTLLHLFLALISPRFPQRMRYTIGARVITKWNIICW